MSDLSEPSEPSNKARDITRLLVKAVNGLPEEERRAVFEYFFERGIGIAPAVPFGHMTAVGPELRGALARGPSREPALATMFTGLKPAGRNQQMIPVRLSEEQHRRLKQWCAEHNFPMSVVVRGLIERFLDSWPQRPA